MNFPFYLSLVYLLFIYSRLVVGLSFGNVMDQNNKDSPANPGNERPPTPNPVDADLSEDELDLFHDDSSSVPTTSPSTSETHRCTLPDMNDEALFGPQSDDSSDDEECDCSPELHAPWHRVPWPEMSTPRFDESSFIMPEIPINRPNCPVPNYQTFMPPHVFNPEMFPQPASPPCNFTSILTNDQNSELPTPDSMPENRQLIHPVPSSHLNLTHMHQPQHGNPPATPQRVFDINEPGPSHYRINPMPGGISQVPPLAPLTVELTNQQMSKLRGELRRVSTIFSRLATAVHRKSCAPLPRTIRVRRNPFSHTTGGPSNMECPNTNVTNCGPTKAKQLKTKEVAAKTSILKTPDKEQLPATEPNPGLLTIVSPNIQPINGPSRRESSTDMDDDEVDENCNIANPKPNLKRRHPEND